MKGARHDRPAARGRGAALAACLVVAAAFATRDAAAASQDAAAREERPTIFVGDPLGNFYDDVQAAKRKHGVPISIGAWHWWHLDRHDPGVFRYGLPGLNGTYYYYLNLDPVLGGADGPQKAGMHVDIRFRDGDQPLRAFYDDKTWLWEGYGWAKVGQTGKLKFGKIWRRFGLDWDGCWYGNVPYFDGWKLDPDWGISWELAPEWNWGGHPKAPTFVQAFFAEDRVNGSLPGADAESAFGYSESGSIILRTVPTWTLANGSTLALGLSGQVERIDRHHAPDETLHAEGVDLTWSRGRGKIFVDVMNGRGVRNPAHYVTGGPTDQSFIAEVGAAIRRGPVTFRGNVSKAWYDDPGGEQVLYLLGMTFAVTRNVDFYVEHVKWDVQADRAPEVRYEDGFQFILNWRF